jgi:hypothetical protein
MRRAFLPLLLCAACTFDLPGSGDRWPCADGGGDACDQNGNPIPGTTGGPGSSANTGSTAGGSSAGASGTSGRTTSTGTGTGGTSGTGTAGTSSTAGSGSSAGSSSAAASSGGASTGASSSSSSGTGGSTAGGTSGGAASTGGSGTGASSGGSGTGASSGGSATGGTSGGASSSGGSSGICLANGGTTVWVNQAQGSDATGTGVATPATCAFKTLTKGLTEAARGGYTFVIAEGASAAKPVLFNSRTGESFPLQVPPGVTLSTDLELNWSQPANSQLAYTIDDDQASVAMVDLTAPGAAISGFTVVNHSGVGLEGVTCSDDGGVTLTDCTLLGSDAGADGVNALGACDLALTNLTIEGFGATGVYSHTVTTIDGGTIEGNGWTAGSTDVGGIWVAGGSLWLQSVTLGGNYFYGLQASAGTVTGQNVTFTGGPAGPAGGAQPVGLGLGVLAAAYPGAKTVQSTASVTLSDVTVDASAQDGIDLNTGTLNLLGNVAITHNAGHGVVDVGADVYLETPAINGNGLSGVENPGLGGTLFIDGGVIGPDDSQGGSPEVALAGSARTTLSGVTVQDNPQAVGIRMGGTGTLSMVGCNVTGNSRSGLLLASGTLATFTGNRVHGNGADQIYVQGGSWNLGSASCNGEQNQIYCYGVGHVGVATVPDAGASATATDDSWANSPPKSGSDYTGNVTLTGGGACSPITTCP